MKVYFKITDIVYEITGDIPELVGAELQEYLYLEEPAGKHKLFVELQAMGEFPPLAGTPIYQSEYYMILKPDLNQGGWLEPEHRIYISKDGSSPSACYIENNDINKAMGGFHSGIPNITVRYNPRFNPIMDMTFMEFLSIDRHLACENAFILHSCFIEHDGSAIIFTAPSGTGKTTQGNLWEKYAGANIINGDRCILKLEDDNSCWAHSLPFCGSSSINHNQSYPVKAVVFLAQGTDNLIQQSLSLTYLKRLMAQTTFSAWASEATIQVLSIYDRFMKDLPFLYYSCRPDNTAVQTLLDYLNKNKL